MAEAGRAMAATGSATEPPGPPRAPTFQRPLLGVALGTFHTALLALIALQLIFRGGRLGEGLADLNTLVGLALFAALWVLVTAASMLAVRGLDLDALSFGHALGRGAWWGGVLGSALVIVPFLLVGPVALLLAVLRGDFQAIAVGLFTLSAVFVAIAAFAVGAVAGFVFAMLDEGLLMLSWLLVPRIGSPLGHAGAAKGRPR